MVSTMGRLTCFTTSKIVKGIFLPVALMFCKLRANEATDYFLPSCINEVELQSSRERTKKVRSLPWFSSGLRFAKATMQCPAAMHCIML